jgi:hypothetical protein
MKKYVNSIITGLLAMQEDNMKKLELAYLPGDEVYVRGQDRTCFIENVSIRKIDKAVGTFTREVTYEWYNLDVGVDCTEVWDDGYFTEDDIGKTRDIHIGECCRGKRNSCFGYHWRFLNDLQNLGG